MSGFAASTPTVARLLRRRTAHRRRHPLYRAGWVVAGFAILALGAVMIVLPGPAFVIMPVGLAMLALEFDWAFRLLASVLRAGSRAHARATNASRGKQVAGGAALVAAIATAATVGISVVI